MAIAMAAGKQLSAGFCLWPQSLKLFQHDLQTFSSPTPLQLFWNDAEVFLNLKRDHTVGCKTLGNLVNSHYFPV